MSKFVWTTINVRDLERSISFYQDLLGLTLDKRIPLNEAMTLVFLKDSNGIEVELIENKTAPPAPISAPNISIGFVVEDLEAMSQKLAEAGYPVKRGPIEAIGIRFFFVEDPNGITVQLIQHL